MDLRSFGCDLYVLGGSNAFVRSSIEVFYRAAFVPYSVFVVDCGALVYESVSGSSVFPIGIFFLRYDGSSVPLYNREPCSFWLALLWCHRLGGSEIHSIFWGILQAYGYGGRGPTAGRLRWLSSVQHTSANIPFLRLHRTCHVLQPLPKVDHPLLSGRRRGSVRLVRSKIIKRVIHYKGPQSTLRDRKRGGRY